MSLRFSILVDGQGDTLRLSLEQAAERVAEGYRRGARVEARALRGSGGEWSFLTKKETEALATAAALRIKEES